MEDRSTPAVLAYSGFHGDGGEQWGYAVAVDPRGNQYLAGTTNTHSSGGDVFVNKVSPAGRVVYSRWFDIGGYGQAVGGIAVDAAGRAVLVEDVFGQAYLRKLNAAGKEILFKDLGYFAPTDVAVDRTGHMYVVGATYSQDLPVVNAYQPEKSYLPGTATRDAYVMKLTPLGEIVYATYFALSSPGTSAHGVAVDAAGNAYVAGRGTVPITPGAYNTTDARSTFVAKFDAAGGLVYSTYLPVASASDVAVDPLGNAYLTGYATAGLPATPAAYQSADQGSGDAFVAKFNATGSELRYATYLGGGGIDGAYAIAVDRFGHAYVTGSTWSWNFPTYRAFQSIHGGGSEDGFVAKFNSTGGLIYSSFLGGAEPDRPEGIAVTPNGVASVAGGTRSANFPNTRPRYPKEGFWDAFVTRVRDNTAIIEFTADDFVFDEAAGTVRITLHRIHMLGVGSTVGYTIAGGSAENGTDFTPVSGTIRFAPGRRTHSIVVKLTNDANVEGNEWFGVSLVSPVNAVLGRAASTVTIVDDDV